MSDKLRDINPVNVSFSAGEQPTAAKLTGWATQIDTGFKKIEEALGDLWNDSYPTFQSSNSLTGAWAYNSAGTNLGSEQRHLQILNLARLVGPASVLNPRVLTGNTVTLTEAVSGGQNEFKTKYAPITSVSFADTGDTGIFASPQGSVGAVARQGEYHVNTTTGVITYICSTASSPADITYTVDISPTNAGDTYEGATFNVIPDPNQSVKCDVTGPSGGKYSIALPQATNQQAGWNELSSTLESDEDPNYLTQLTLPSSWDGEFTTGNTIPDGLVKIWDAESFSFLEGQIFYYVDQSNIEVNDSITLSTGDDRYSLVVMGTDITRTLDQLRTRFHHHTHTGSDGSRVIDHSVLTGKATGFITLSDIDGGTDLTVGWTRDSGEINNNDHPQYLHREGMDDSELKNAMFGDLLLAPTEWDETGDDIFHIQSPSNFLNTSVSSRVRFMHPSTGPSIYAGSNSVLGLGIIVDSDLVRLTNSMNITSETITADDDLTIDVPGIFKLKHNAGQTILIQDDTGVRGGLLTITGDATTGGDLEVNGRIRVLNSDEGGFSNDGAVVAEAGFTDGLSIPVSWYVDSAVISTPNPTETVDHGSLVTNLAITSGTIYGFDVMIHDSNFTDDWYDGQGDVGHEYSVALNTGTGIMTITFIGIDWGTAPSVTVRTVITYHRNS